VYISWDTVWINSTAFTFTHNLWLTSADVLKWRYRVIVVWQTTSTRWAIFNTDTIDQNYVFGEWSSNRWTFLEWNAWTPTSGFYIYFQTNTVKIYLWTSGVNMTAFKCIIQRMY
jgi:hypothetical protein